MQFSWKQQLRVDVVCRRAVAWCHTIQTVIFACILNLRYEEIYRLKWDLLFSLSRAENPNGLLWEATFYWVASYFQVCHWFGKASVGLVNTACLILLLTCNAGWNIHFPGFKFFCGTLHFIIIYCRTSLNIHYWSGVLPIYNTLMFFSTRISNSLECLTCINKLW